MASAAASSEKPGFFAADVHEALRKRAEWLDGLGESAILDADNLDSDDSEHWEGSTTGAKEEPVASDGAEAGGSGAKSTGLKGSLSDLLAAGFARVECEPLDLSAARERFARADKGSVPLMLEGRPEPPARRLQRLKSEVSTLAAWAEHQSSAEVADGQDAKRLGQEARAMAEDMKDAQAPNDPHHIWLPPSDGEELRHVSRLVAATPKGPAKVTTEGLREDSAPYTLSAPSSGWLLAAQAEALQDLEARLESVRNCLGTAEEEASETLAAATSRLSRRLQWLEDIADGGACERLSASAELLCAEIDLAAAEAARLEALEAEQEKEEAELIKPVSPTSRQLAEEVTASVETTAAQVQRLFDQVAGLDAAVVRAADMAEQLRSQDALRRHLELFAAELAQAEARCATASDTLRAAAKAASDMKESSKACTEQIQRGIQSLEAKILKLKGHRDRKSVV